MRKVGLEKIERRDIHIYRERKDGGKKRRRGKGDVRGRK